MKAEWVDNPFPHAVVDDFWDADFLVACRNEFPIYEDYRWKTYNDPEEFGKKAGGIEMWGPNTKEFFRRVRTSEFAEEMEATTGIDQLTADDIGGGMHMTGPDGRLEMHIDFNVHPTKPLERRLNMLVFLNDEWDASWGGVLYLGANKEVEVLPLFNRTVIFECSEASFHGHPDPIVGDHYRRSLACYFYAPLREGVLEKAHTTIWRP
jgi:hypothetical protein